MFRLFLKKNDAKIENPSSVIKKPTVIQRYLAGPEELPAEKLIYLINCPSEFLANKIFTQFLAAIILDAEQTARSLQAAGPRHIRGIFVVKNTDDAPGPIINEKFVL